MGLSTINAPVIQLLSKWSYSIFRIYHLFHLSFLSIDLLSERFWSFLWYHHILFYFNGCMFFSCKRNAEEMLKWTSEIFPGPKNFQPCTSAPTKNTITSFSCTGIFLLFQSWKILLWRIKMLSSNQLTLHVLNNGKLIPIQPAIAQS